MIPSFDGTDFRQSERRVRLFGGPGEKGGENFWSDWKDVHPIGVKEYRTWKH